MANQPDLIFTTTIATAHDDAAKWWTTTQRLYPHASKDTLIRWMRLYAKHTTALYTRSETVKAYIEAFEGDIYEKLRNEFEIH